MLFQFVHKKNRFPKKKPDLKGNTPNIICKILYFVSENFKCYHRTFTKNEFRMQIYRITKNMIYKIESTFNILINNEKLKVN
jgi:hypothetical protein